MPKYIFKAPRIIFKYTKNLDKKVARKLLKAFSEWQENLYPIVIARTPKYRSIDKSRRPGFVASKIKLVNWRGAAGIRYRTMAVPGATIKGSPPYHAMMAILSHHNLARTGVITIKPKGKVMTFPLGPTTIRNPKTLVHGPGGERGGGPKGPKRWVITRKVTQTHWAEKRNPWISNIYEEKKRDLISLLKTEIERGFKERKGKGKFELS